MSDEKYDLSPTDGISDHWVTLDGMDVIHSAPGAATFRFRIFRNGDGREIDLGILSFNVEPRSLGTQDMFARAHDQLVDALRQMLHHADVARRAYRGSPE